MPPFQHVKSSWAVNALAFVMCAVGPMMALERRSTVPLLIAACVPLVAVIGKAGVTAALRPSSFMTGIGILVLWAALSNVWGQETHFVTLARVTFTALLGLFMARGFGMLSAEDGKRVDFWMIAGGVCLLAYLAEEAVTGAKIASFLHPEPKFQFAGAYYPRFFDSAGQGAALLAPTCYAVAALVYMRTRSVIWPALYVAVALFATYRLPMAAAPLAIALGALAFVAAYFLRRLTFIAIFAGFTLYLLAAPLISATSWPFDPTVSPPTSASGLEREDAMGRQLRIKIWHHTAGLILRAPVLGHGFDAARDISAANERFPDVDFAVMPIHPHNGALQMWLELGGVGVLIVVGLLGLSWRATAALWDQPLAAATVAATLVATAIFVLVSSSLWNYWWLADQGFAAIFAVRAVKGLSPGPRTFT